MEITVTESASLGILGKLPVGGNASSFPLGRKVYVLNNTEGKSGDGVGT